jgi:putative nucleotidyltransferase with HDIG domain
MRLDSKAVLLAFPFLQKVVSRFPGAEIYLVGGAVRDLLLRGKGADYDFLVRNVPATELEAALSREGKVVLAGKDFGVFKFYPADRDTSPEVDIALPRREISLMTGGYRDFDVQSDPTLPVEEDLSRRDFTVNAMALSLFDGRVIDPFGGMRDLQSQRLRAVGDPSLRFAEDSSRLLRGIRLACQLGFAIEPSTWAALVSAVPRLNARRFDGSFVVPREVIAKELLRGLVSDPVWALDLLDQSGIVRELLPELIPMKGCPQPPEFHSEGDVWTHTRLALSHLRSPRFAEEFGDAPADGELVLATLLHDVGKPYTIQTPERDGTDRIRFNEHDRVGSEIALKISQRLKLFQLPKEGPLHIDPERLAWLIGKHLLLVHGEVGKMRVNTLERHFLDPSRPGDQLRKLIFVDGLASVPANGEGQLEGFYALKRRLAEIERLSLSKDAVPKPLLSGDDVMALLGLSPGPEIGRLLSLLREEQLAGRIRHRKEAEDFIKSL